MIINIDIVNKTATAIGSPIITCGNSDYSITFTFDDEWDTYHVKTARFKFKKDGRKEYYEVAFSGTDCAVPVLSDITEVEVGVYAGDLSTTTSARVPCRRSVLCGSGTHTEPPEDVYNQLVALVESGILKGDPGSIKFQVLNELPATGSEDTMYLIPSESSATPNIYDEYIYVNNQWEPLGQTQVEIDLTDYIKNTDYATTEKHGIIKIFEPYGLRMHATGNGTIYINRATNDEIDGKNGNYKPIVPITLDYAVKSALSNCQLGTQGYGEPWTEEEKAAARELLGAAGIKKGPGEFQKIIEAGAITEDNYVIDCTGYSEVYIDSRAVESDSTLEIRCHFSNGSSTFYEYGFTNLTEGIMSEIYIKCDDGLCRMHIEGNETAQWTAGLIERNAPHKKYLIPNGYYLASVELIKTSATINHDGIYMR